MKVYIEQDTNKIYFPEDYVSLEDITDEGDFVYKVRYVVKLANLLKAAKEKKTYVAQISVIKDQPESQKATVFTQGFEAKKIVNNLQKQASNQKDINRNEAKKVLYKKLSDITKKIPNDKLVDINRAIQNNFSDIPGVKKYFSYAVYSTDELKTENINAPVLEMNLNKSFKDSSIDATTGNIREESLKLVNVHNIDPADFVCRRSNSILPAMKQHSGLTGNSSWFLKKQNDPNESKKIEILFKSLLSDMNVSSHAQIPNAAYANVITKIEETEVEIEEILNIPKQVLSGDKFILRIELITSKNIVVQKMSEVVNHSQLVSLLQSPTIPPNIKLMSTGITGRNLIQLEQNDRTATAIAVYKKTIASDLYSLNSDYQKVSVVNLTSMDAGILIEDKALSPNPVIYRAVSIGSDGQNGSDFSSVVAPRKRVKSTLENSMFFKRPSHLVLTNEIRDTKNLLFIDNIPIEAVALELYRRDLTIKGDWMKVGITYPLKHVATRPIEISDSRLKKRRIYEYQCYLTYPDGTQTPSGNNLVIEFNLVESNVVDVQIENLKIDSNNPNDVDVMFDIRKSIILTQTDILKSLLIEQGITEFDVNLESNKHKLSDLFFLKVARKNMNTGQIEDYGIVDGLSFSDKVYGKIKNVSALQPNTTYKYEISAYSRAAETLFTDLSRSVDVRTNAYNLKPAKYYHPVTLNEGNIVTEASYKKNHSFSQFSIGRLCDVKYVTVNFSENLPKILEAKAVQLNEKKIVLNWITQGNSSLFDHFIIVLEINGMRTIVGKTYGPSEKNNYRFIDNLDNGEHGPLEYIITPVYYDFTRGNPIRTSAIII